MCATVCWSSKLTSFPLLHTNFSEFTAAVWLRLFHQAHRLYKLYLQGNHFTYSAWNKHIKNNNRCQSLLFSHITESQATKLQQYVKTSLLFWTQQHHKICHPGTSTTTDTDVSKASFYVCVSFGVCTILHCAEWIWVDSRYFTFLFSYTEKAYFLWYSSVSFLLFYSHAVNNSFVYL